MNSPNPHHATLLTGPTTILSDESSFSKQGQAGAAEEPKGPFISDQETGAGWEEGEGGCKPYRPLQHSGTQWSQLTRGLQDTVIFCLFQNTSVREGQRFHGHILLPKRLHQHLGYFGNWEVWEHQKPCFRHGGERGASDQRLAPLQLTGGQHFSTPSQWGILLENFCWFFLR